MIHRLKPQDGRALRLTFASLSVLAGVAAVLFGTAWLESIPKQGLDACLHEVGRRGLSSQVIDVQPDGFSWYSLSVRCRFKLVDGSERIVLREPVWMRSGKPHSLAETPAFLALIFIAGSILSIVALIGAKIGAFIFEKLAALFHWV